MNFSLKPMKVKYDKQDQQGKAAFNERNPYMTQQQVPMARSPGGPSLSCRNKYFFKKQLHIHVILKQEICT
jgi:hypothetical protein